MIWYTLRNLQWNKKQKLYKKLPKNLELCVTKTKTLWILKLKKNFSGLTHLTWKLNKLTPILGWILFSALDISSHPPPKKKGEKNMNQDVTLEEKGCCAWSPGKKNTPLELLWFLMKFQPSTGMTALWKDLTTSRVSCFGRHHSSWVPITPAFLMGLPP